MGEGRGDATSGTGHGWSWHTLHPYLVPAEHCVILHWLYTGEGVSGLAELQQGGKLKISITLFPAPFLCQLRKPLIERKRRERINNCLDQLKETVVGAFHLDVSAHFMLLFVILLVGN